MDLERDRRVRGGRDVPKDSPDWVQHDGRARLGDATTPQPLSATLEGVE